MKVTCEIELGFESAEMAMTVARALSIENQGYVSQTLNGSRILARIEADTVRGLRSTIDDYLACARVAEANARKAITSR
jgi:tRNA threonylcarbamoyladenosine modification (KEOPS) complex  Pcc1 subunit